MGEVLGKQHDQEILNNSNQALNECILKHKNELDKQVDLIKNQLNDLLNEESKVESKNQIQDPEDGLLDQMLNQINQQQEDVTKLSQRVTLKN